MKRYEKLLSPLRVGNTYLKNRIVCAPTAVESSTYGERYPMEEAVIHYANQAKNGAALVTVSGGSIRPVQYDGHIHIWDMYEHNSLNALAHMAACIHMHDAKCSMELIRGAIDIDGYTVSDGVQISYGGIGREMPEKVMLQVAEDYAAAAANLQEAGWDGVCLQFAHGWTPAQFLSPLTNRRTDKYGGSIENRSRFLKLIIDSIRDRVGPDMLIDVRVSGDEFTPGGLGVEDVICFGEIIQDQADILHISAGMHSPRLFGRTHPCGFLPPMANTNLAAAVKASGRIKIPVLTVGAITDPDGAEQLLRTGAADLIGVARAFIADTEFGKKIYEDRKTDIRPCVKCMRCHDSMAYGHKFSCTVNPMIGMEHVLDRQLQAPAGKKRVAVVGGGPGGMQAALAAAARGHDVTLFEKSGELGGQINFARYVDFKYGLHDYRNYLVRQVEKSAVQVRLHTQASPELLAQGGYDLIIPALGAEPVRLQLPGAEEGGLQLATDIYGRADSLPETVAVIGGGQVGCETGLYLARLGKKVTVLEMRPELAPDASTTHRWELLYQLAWEKNITCITGARVQALLPGGLRFAALGGHCKRLENQKDLETCFQLTLGSPNPYQRSRFAPAKGPCVTQELQAEAALLAAGMRARSEAALAYYGAAPRVIPVGDCVRARTVEQAVKEGFFAGNAI